MLRELVWHTLWIDIEVYAGGWLGVEGKVVGMLVSWLCNYQHMRHVNPIFNIH